MPIPRPSLQTLIDRISGDVQAGTGGTAPLLQVSILTVLARVFAGTAHLLWGYLTWISDQVFPDTAEAAYLERWAAVYGIYRIPATYASGEVQFAGTNTTVIPAGTVLVGAGGTEYASAADVAIGGGTATLNVTALTPGSIGTLGVGQVLQLLQPLAGVQSTGTVQATALTAGADAETDDALRTRLLKRIQDPPQGGSASDYVEWMLASPDIPVQNAWVYGDYEGPGSVGITFAVAGGPIPSGPQVDAMEAYIQELAPVTARVVAFAPVLHNVAVHVHIVPDTTALRTAVTASLQDFFGNAGEPGSTLYLSQLNEAIASVPGIVDHGITLPSGNISIAANELGALGAISWT